VRGEMLLKIRNVVSTSDLHQHIDARKFNQYQWGSYDIELYGGRCGYIKDEGIQGSLSFSLRQNDFHWRYPSQLSSFNVL
jgi:hypothetical protein